jgi:hypothetical protein
LPPAVAPVSTPRLRNGIAGNGSASNSRAQAPLTVKDQMGRIWR